LKSEIEITENPLSYGAEDFNETVNNSEDINSTKCDNLTYIQCNAETDEIITSDITQMQNIDIKSIIIKKEKVNIDDVNNIENPTQFDSVWIKSEPQDLDDCEETTDWCKNDQLASDLSKIDQILIKSEPPEINNMSNSSTVSINPLPDSSDLQDEISSDLLTDSKKEPSDWLESTPTIEPNTRVTSSIVASNTSCSFKKKRVSRALPFLYLQYLYYIVVFS
jgi:hypothetical protein